MQEPLKILGIQFKYLGDVAVMVPALRALKKSYPHAQLHVLVPEEAVPILENTPWIHKVWGFPRKRGKWAIGAAWPVVRSLRAEGFSLTIDFVGNDRGAILTTLIGAPERVGLAAPKGFWGRHALYTRTRTEPPIWWHESKRILDLLQTIGIKGPQDISPELYSDASLKSWAQEALGEGAILINLTTSMPKKEWPIEYWVKLYELATGLRERFVFVAGPSEREQGILSAVCQQIAHARAIPKIPNLRHLMALIACSKLIVVGDTGPIHLAAGLGVAYVGLYGPSPIELWHPHGIGQVLIAPNCPCYGHPRSCIRQHHCLKAIHPQQVLAAMLEYL